MMTGEFEIKIQEYRLHVEQEGKHSMRKMQKNQILEIIDSLQQAHEEIKTVLQQKNNVLAQKQTIFRMLCECQETAVSVGESIEKAEGEKHITVSYLEEYCELLFKIYEEIGGSTGGALGTDNSANAVDKVFINENKIYKSLRKQLIKIENSVKNDIIARKEIAFFPYKASMWDSLESVYLAAKEEPDCDAYCIPIPYYDLKPDHSFGEMHYEGNQYPKNIEITNWQAYSFEERRPDEIYIHNGYDNWNLVTSVHPRFYSANLKKYTEKLIYIPYFILGEIEPDNQEAIDGMKHFCFMPGIINADKVIVQSEKMKQIYVNEYLKAAKANGFTGKHLDKEYLNQKFLGLGSPKIDKVLNTKKEDLEIPQEWLRVIQKPDGSWKKIILYNTSIGQLLSDSEKWTNKIEVVLKIFYEHQDEIALWWRPHPLIESTIQSMRPDILARYIAIKDEYIRQSWGIFDDTPDMDRAIAISDAYFGDGSSVAYIYKATCKPVMIQNINENLYSKQKQEEISPYRFKELLSNENYMLKFENLYDDGDVFWFTSYDFNALFKMNKDTWKAEYMGMFPDEDELGLRLYADIIEHDNKLYFTPMGAREIGVYDKLRKEFSKISFDNLQIRFLEGCRSWSFYSAHLVEECIYFMPLERTAVLKYDIRNDKISAVHKWVSVITDVYNLTAERLVFKSLLKGHCIYAPIAGCNLVEKINLATGEAKVYEVGRKDSTYFDICTFYDNYIIAPLSGEEIIIWSDIGSTINTINLDKDKSGIYQIFSLLNYQDSVYVFPYQYGEFLKIINKKEETVAIAEDNLNQTEEIKGRHPTDSRYVGSRIGTDGHIYLYDTIDKKMMEYDIETGKIRKQAIFLEPQIKKIITEKIKNFFIEKMREPELFVEQYAYNIVDFLTVYMKE